MISVRIAWASVWFVSFFFQAEDGIRDLIVTGVQTCALPISEIASFNFLPALPHRSLRNSAPVSSPSKPAANPTGTIGSCPSKLIGRGASDELLRPGLRTHRRHGQAPRALPRRTFAPCGPGA